MFFLSIDDQSSRPARWSKGQFRVTRLESPCFSAARVSLWASRVTHALAEELR